MALIEDLDLQRKSFVLILLKQIENFVRVCIIMLIIFIFLVEKKSLNLKLKIKMLTLQLEFVSELFLMDAVLLS